MQIYKTQSFRGRNIYSHKPVIRLVVDIEEQHDKETKELKDFNESLVKLLPGLSKHYCSLGYEGGFIERLKEGTYLGHVTEHVILELQSLMGYEVNYGKTRMLKEPSLYFIVYEYSNERCGIECGKAAAKIVNKLIKGETIDLEVVLEEIRKSSEESELGPSAKAIFEEAKERGIPVMRVGNESLLQLGYGKHLRLIEASLTDTTSCISVDIAGNKQLTKQILSDNNIPVPSGGTAYTEDSAAVMAKEIGFPLVIKPFDSNQGKGVTINIGNETQARAAFNEAVKYSKAAVVEEFIEGKDYRVLVVGDKISAAAERRPPSITGDGIHTIKELIEIENRNSLRGNDHEKPLTKIKLDSAVMRVISDKGLDESHILKEGESLNLRYNGNLSTGGTARDCTGEIHPQNSLLAVKAAKAIGIDVAGIDITARDISIPLKKGNGAIIEVNAAPGLRMHLYPTEGHPRNVAADIMDMIFPQGQPYTIPVVAITGTNGKTTTTRLISYTLSLTGKMVGMTSTSGIYIGSECVLKGDNTGPESARIVLSNKEVEAAVLETARGGIVKRGLGYDMADVGIVVNISDDHIGLDDLNSLEDLAYVKSLVIEAVKPAGWAVLNADDEMVNYMLGRVKSRVILFSKNERNPIILEHVKNGGTAVYVKENSVFIYDKKNEICILNISEIPITFDGVVDCNVENALAAVSGLYGLNTPIELIRLGLKSFKPDVMSNPGRFNIFDMGDFKVMLDYSHNTAGYNAVLNFVQKMGAARLVGVIGMPGDRLERSIHEVGEMCGRAFSRIYIKEDCDLRGRKPGEVAEILFKGVLKGGARKENIDIINSELKALESAILDAQPGDLIVMFYEEFESVVELINRFKQELEQSAIQPEIILGETAG